MFLLINPTYNYIFKNDNIIPIEWLYNHTRSDILIIDINDHSFKHIDINNDCISKIYKEQLVNDKPVILPEYCNFHCYDCGYWVNHTNVYGNCYKCYKQLCNNCIELYNNNGYCENCYDYIIDNDSIS